MSRIEWGGFLMSVRRRRCIPRDYLRTFYHRHQPMDCWVAR
jgi:hypothetical protein